MNQYDQTGSYLGIAGFVVMVLTHFGFNATIDQIAAVIGACVTLYGIIHQYTAHKNLAVATGALVPKE